MASNATSQHDAVGSPAATQQRRSRRRPDAFALTVLAISAAVAVIGALGYRRQSAAELDACVAPFSALSTDARWRSSGSDGAPSWLLAGGSDDGNRARLPDLGNARYEASLQSPTFHVPARGADIEFTQRRDYSWANTMGVLEISIGDGPFEDIAASGATFASGAYDAQSPAANPLGFRDAWSAAPGFDTRTRLRLPAASNDRLVRLRFRLGSSGTGDALPGWTIDGIRCVIEE